MSVCRPRFRGDGGLAFLRHPDPDVGEAPSPHVLARIDVAQIDDRLAAIISASRRKSSARNTSHSVTITSASAPVAQS